MEVVQERVVKLDKKNLGFVPTFFVIGTVYNVVETWKRKSVTLVSPHSGRILRQRSKESNEGTPERVPKENGIFQRLFEDFKKAKVSDFSYQPSKVRQNSVYKPFWATKVLDAKEVKEEVVKATSDVVVENRRFVNEHLYFGSKVVETVQWTNASVVHREVVKPRSADSHLLVTLHSEHRLKTPLHYAGSKIFLPTGEQVYWV